jgi:ApaG protein
MNEHKHFVDVSVVSHYQEAQSDEELGRFVFIYNVMITNCSTEPVQLLSRHWIITDGNGEVREVKGEGVVGLQPTLDVGEVYQYSSGAVLGTDVGTMEGSYTFKSDSGDEFEAPIQPFLLARRKALH